MCIPLCVHTYMCMYMHDRMPEVCTKINAKVCITIKVRVHVIACVHMCVSPQAKAKAHGLRGNNQPSISGGGGGTSYTPGGRSERVCGEGTAVCGSRLA